MTDEFSPEKRAEILIEVLPYIKQFSGSTIVIKLGGNSITDDSLITSFAEDIAILRSVGIKPVIVHGGGPQIGKYLNDLGHESSFQDGLRVTDEKTLEIARMVLVGKVGRDIVGQLNTHGAIAVGVSGEDGGLIKANPLSKQLGFVGEIESVNPDLINKLLDQDLTPVIAPISSDQTGQAYNQNADTVAGAIAEAIKAKRVIYLTDVAGLLKDVKDKNSRIGKITISQLVKRMTDNKIEQGMIPKINSCIAAINGGCESAHLLDGRIPHVLLLELFTDKGIGTMITKESING